MNRDTPSPVLEKPTKIRYGVLGFACALSMITYLDRVCIGKAQDDIQKILGFSSVADLKWAFTAFSLAYALFEVPTGWLGDVFGPRKTLVRIVVWWSLFTALTGLTGVKVAGVTLIGFGTLVVIRFLFGIGEAGAYPNITRALHNWFPLTERARTQGVLWMSGRLMGGLTPLVWLFLVGVIGLSWRATFFVFGGLGLVWCVAWLAWFRNRPEEHPSTNEAERELITHGTGHSTANAHANVPWVTLLKSRNLWLICVMYFCMSYGWYFNVNYLPAYLKEQHDVSKAGVLGRLYEGGPLCFGAVGCLLGGFLSDWIIRRTGSHRWGRRVSGMIGHAACVPCYLVCIVAPSAWMFALALALSGFFNDLAMGPAWATCQDIGKRYAAIVAGCMNTIGNLGGAASAYLIGMILDYTLQAHVQAQGQDLATVKAAAAVTATDPGSWAVKEWGEQLVRAGNLPGYQINFLIFALIYVVTVFLWLGIDATKPVIDEPPMPADVDNASGANPPE